MGKQDICPTVFKRDENSSFIPYSWQTTNYNLQMLADWWKGKLMMYSECFCLRKVPATLIKDLDLKFWKTIFKFLKRHKDPREGVHFRLFILLISEPDSHFLFVWLRTIAQASEFQNFSDSKVSKHHCRQGTIALTQSDTLCILVGWHCFKNPSGNHDLAPTNLCQCLWTTSWLSKLSVNSCLPVQFGPVRTGLIFFSGQKSSELAVCQALWLNSTWFEGTQAVFGGHPEAGAGSGERISKKKMCSFNEIAGNWICQVSSPCNAGCGLQKSTGSLIPITPTRLSDFN